MNTKKRIISMTVIDEPGVLTKITALIMRRNFNIDTITVGKTEKKDISRITISLEENDNSLEQLEKQLNKMIDIYKVSEITHDSHIRELMLAKINIKDENARSELLGYSQIAGARPIDMTKNGITIEYVDTPENLDALLKKIQPFGIKELVRTGLTGISK